MSDRKTVLFKAALELLEKQNRTLIAWNVLAETVYYDGADCDGYCLLEDIRHELKAAEDVV